MINTKKLNKCPHEMVPVKVPQAAWKQIGRFLLFWNMYMLRWNKFIQILKWFVNLCNFYFAIAGVDLIEPLKEYEGKQCIATAVCYFTKFVEAKATSSKIAE